MTIIEHLDNREIPLIINKRFIQWGELKCKTVDFQSVKVISDSNEVRIKIVIRGFLREFIIQTNDPFAIQQTLCKYNKQ